MASGPSLKLNTADFELYLGGRHLLESSTLDGHLLEDGSGVRLLDTVIPSLGDPVTFTNPTWSGRVVSVTSQDIVDKRTNYNLVTIAATNQSAAPGGTAPGAFSDVPAGGRYQLEDGSGFYLLEDGSGYYLLEGTSFGYRHLSVKESQNQDGGKTTYGSLETFETGFLAGQTITVTSVNLGIAETSYTITNVTTSFIGVPPTPVYLVEFGDAYPTLQTAGGGVLTQQQARPSQQAGVIIPAGTLGYAAITADQTGITTVVDIDGLSVTVTVGSGRRILIGCPHNVQSATVGDLIDVSIKEGATILNFVRTRADVVNVFKAGYVEVTLTPTAGTHTYKITCGLSSGTGAVQYRAGAAFPSSIKVQDIGT